MNHFRVVPVLVVSVFAVPWLLPGDGVSGTRSGGGFGCGPGGWVPPQQAMDIAGALKGRPSQAAHAGRRRIAWGSVGRGGQARRWLVLTGQGAAVTCWPGRAAGAGAMAGRLPKAGLPAISGWAASWVLFGIR